MEKFKEGDYIGLNNELEYFEQCLSIQELHENLRPGDYILTHRNNKNNILGRATFIEFKKCNFQNSSSNYDSCKRCKGYLILKNHENHMCSGYIKKGLSCVLKIIKNKRIPLFEKEMFEL